jgi:hypothetical protein
VSSTSAWHVMGQSLVFTWCGVSYITNKNWQLKYMLKISYLQNSNWKHTDRQQTKISLLPYSRASVKLDYKQLEKSTTTFRKYESTYCINRCHIIAVLQNFKA